MITNDIIYDFLMDGIRGDLSLFYSKKYKHIPNRLFRFEKFSNARLDTLKQNQIRMTEAERFNDPFDCLGIFWDSATLTEFSKTQGLSYIGESLDKEIDKMFREALTPLKVTCFSSELYNLPLWGNYAESGSGFAVEYDFKQLGVNSDFTKLLYPVIYREEREDITGVLKKLIEVASNGQFHPLLRLLFYKNLIKHISWAYEKEWRLIFIEKESFIKMPIKPTAIYITDRCDGENEKLLKEIALSLECDFYKLVPTKNNRNFIFEESLAK